MSEIIRLTDVSKNYSIGSHEVPVLHGVTCAFHRQESVSIMGQSGSGKTTLLHILGLLLNATAGQVLIDAQETGALSSAQKAALRNSFFGYVTQDFSLIEQDTVYQNVTIPLLYRNDRVGKADRLRMARKVLEDVGLADHLATKAKHLSGGQRQRVAIARALINSPSVLLCDEPTGSLDKATGEEIFALLTAQVAEGKSLILVTHNQNLADRCGRKLLLADGQLTEI